MSPISEFATLLNLADKQGVNRPDLLHEVKTQVLNAYKDKYPQAPISTEVFLDETTGKIRFLSQDQDVTPPEFTDTAESLARLTLIQHVATPPGPEVKSTFTSIKPSSPQSWFMIFIYWAYHFFYLAYISLFLIGILFSQNLYRWWETIKNVPLTSWLYGLILFLTPIFSLFYILKSKYSRVSHQLAQMFFQVEIPTLFLTTLMLFLTLQLPASVQFLSLFLVILPLFNFLLHLPGYQLSAKWQKWTSWFQIWILLTLGYAVLLWLFYLPVLTGTFAKLLFEGLFSGWFFQNPYGAETFTFPLWLLQQLLGAGLRLFGFLSLVALIVLPLILFYRLLVSWIKSLHLYHTDNPRFWSRWYLAGSMIWLALLSSLTLSTNSSPLLTTLVQYHEATTYEAKVPLAQTLITQKTPLTTALKDIYNQQSHYLFSTDKHDLSDAYQEIFRLPQSLANLIQQTFLTCAYPLVYHSPGNWATLETAYTDLFGHKLWSQPDSSVPTTNISLVSRTITAVTGAEKLWGTITIDETFANQSWSDQEVIYEFTLPSEAVITHLALGPNLEYPGQIAPRGAAQQTYQQELAVRRDPALLETIGPNLYRLRVFPIPGTNNNLLLGKPQRVQFTYLTPLTATGYALPRYLRFQNLKTNRALKLQAQVDQKLINLDQEAQTLPINTNLLTSACQKPIPSTTLNLGSGPVTFNSTSCTTPTPQIQKIAVLLDMSAGGTNDQLAYLDKLKNLPPALQINIIPFNNSLGNPQPLNAWQTNPFKNTRFGQRSLTALNPLLKSGKYDALILVLGKAANNNDINNWKFPVSTSPIYLVLSKGGTSLNPETQVKLIQNGGAVFATISDVLDSLSQPIPFISWQDPTPPTYSSLQEYLNSLQSITTKTEPAYQLATSALLFRQLKAYAQPVQNNLIILDSQYQLAKNAGIITPFASLIALVNQQQQANLEVLSTEYNRYDDRTFTTNPSISVPRPMNFNLTDPLSPLMGMDISTSKTFAPAIGGGGGNLGAVAMVGGGRAYDLFGSGFSLFVLVNLLVIGLGIIWWLFHFIRTRHQKSK